MLVRVLGTPLPGAPAVLAKAAAVLGTLRKKLACLAAPTPVPDLDRMGSSTKATLSAVQSGKPIVLHLCGSRVSEYYEGVSAYYASQCFETVVTQGTYEHCIAMVHMDGTWSFPKDFSDTAKAEAERLDMPAAMQVIKGLAPACVVPHMFCYPGMTTYRALFDAMQIPLVGNDANVMALSTNKAQSRAVVAAAGVRVPDAEILRKGDKPKMSLPFVLKPCNEDNSMGITLYTGKDGQKLEEALETASALTARSSANDTSSEAERSAARSLSKRTANWSCCRAWSTS